MTFAALTQRRGVPMHLRSCTLPELLDVVRTAGEEPSLSQDSLPAPEEIASIIRRIDHATGERVQNLILR